jgi:hypothetical protein
LAEGKRQGDISNLVVYNKTEEPTREKEEDKRRRRRIRRKRKREAK